MLKRSLPYFCVILLAAPFPAMAKIARHKPTVIASFSIIADMVKEVAGDSVTVQTLVPAGSDVHVYEPTPNDARNFAKADIIFVNGLGFESWMDRLVQSSDTKAKIVTVSRGVIPIQVNLGEIDPHAWQDISNGMIYVDRIRDALIENDPSNAGLYRSNADRYLKELIELDHWVKVKIGELPEDSRKAITSHDALRYFVRTYHIHLIAAQGLSTDGELSAKSMAAIIDQIKAEHVKALFLENMGNPELIEQLAEDSGATIGGTLYSDSLSESSDDGGTYILMFKHNVKVLTEALKK